MMDAYVQFIRNGMCTIKNFNFLGDTFLYDPKFTAIYYNFPPPLDQTTPLEILIAITQFYALVSLTFAGYKMITKSGINKLQLISRLINLRIGGTSSSSKSSTTNQWNDMTVAELKDELKNRNLPVSGLKATLIQRLEEHDNKKNSDEKSEALAKKLVEKSLVDESDAATRSFFVGTNLFMLGLSFIWLTANSFHITNTNWIGGVIGLIHALTVAEINLIVFLYYMVKDAGATVRKSYQMSNYASTIETSKNKLSLESDITVEQYSWLVDGWGPFWADGSSAGGAEEKMMTKEEEAVTSKLVAFTHNVDQDTLDRTREQSRITLFEGFREYVYLVLNVFAFYGYLVCIIVFYYEDQASQPEYIRAMLGYLPNADADWLGNAVGDFAWTVEPVLILTSPMLIARLSGKKKQKEKVA